MRESTVVICVDGLDPDYLEACETPNLRELAREGFFKVGQSMMPSVTNVNNVSVMTGAYPAVHGICSNYRLVPETGAEVYMESGDDVLTETMFQRATRQSQASILVTAKDKLRTLLADSATVTASSERPPSWLVDGVGEPPGIYTLEVNGWVIRAAGHIMSRFPSRVVYVTTTDYAMHTFAPDELESRKHMAVLDEAVGRLVETHPEATVLITADHGMSAKTRMVDLGGALAANGTQATAVPVIKDRYVVHHSNLGGSAFVYLRGGAPGALGQALRVLRETAGVEEAVAWDEAAARFSLHRERIGDIFVTGDPDVVFGDPSEVQIPPRLRSHGSVHERPVPIIGYNGDFDGFSFEENRDVGRYVFERVLV